MREFLRREPQDTVGRRQVIAFRRITVMAIVVEVRLEGSRGSVKVVEEAQVQRLVEGGG